MAESPPDESLDLRSPVLLERSLDQVDSLDGLQDAVFGIIPSFLSAGYSSTNDMPLPPDVVEGITEEDIQVLQECFSIPDVSRYARWAWHFLDVNSLLEHQRERTHNLILKMKEMDLPLPRFAFLITGAYLEFTGSQMRFLSTHSARSTIPATRQEADTIRTAATVLLDLFDRAENALTEPLVLGGRASIRDWRKKDDLRNLLDELLQRVNHYYENAAAFHERVYLCKPNAPNKQLDMPDCVYLAYEKTKEEVREFAASSNMTLEGVVRELFHLVGISINDGRYRTWKSRRPPVTS